MKLDRFFIWRRRHWRGLTVSALAALFFIGAGAFNFLTESPDFMKWGSPDETANYVMAGQMAATGWPLIKEELNLTADNLVAPRSLLADGVWLKPVSFLGVIIYYGLLAKLLGLWVLPYLTPFLAAAAIVIFYLLVKKFLNPDIAWTAAWLAAIFPPLIYYSVRGLFHNVPFAAWLIIATYLATLAARRQTGWTAYGLAVLAGYACGLALAMRGVEVLWLGPLIIYGWLVNWRQWRLAKSGVWLFGLALALAPVAYYNQLLYGAPWLSGYPGMNRAASDLVNGSALAAGQVFAGQLTAVYAAAKQIYHALFYFSARPIASLLNLWLYFIKMFYWWWWLAVIGWLRWTYLQWRDRQNKRWWLAVLPCTLIFIWLTLYYGSWQISDNIDPNAVTIGNSYTRYWLPLYLAAIPWAAFGLIDLSRRFWPRHPVRPAAIILILLTAWSAWFVLAGSAEGLIPAYRNFQESRLIYQHVLTDTEPNSIIITRYHDKLFFPERAVIMKNFTDRSTVAVYAKLLRERPLYYFNLTLPEKDLRLINDQQLRPSGLVLVWREAVTPELSLYSLQKK